MCTVGESSSFLRHGYTAPEARVSQLRCCVRAELQEQRGQQSTVSQFVAALKQCSNLEGGKALHRNAAEAGLHTDRYVASSLIRMYSKCRCMAFAQQVFDGLSLKNAVIWNSLIVGYVENGESSVAMDLFFRMDCDPDFITYIAALKACGRLAREKESEKEIWLQKGIMIHKQTQERRFESQIGVSAMLVDMYRKCGSMQRARAVFDRMISKDVKVWTCLLKGYVENGESSVAMDLFARMDCQANSYTFAVALSACGIMGCENAITRGLYLQKGLIIHKQVQEQGLESHLIVATALVDMYRKCSSIQRAKAVFDKMVSKDVVTWSSLVLGYVENGESLRALKLFEAMDCEPNYVTYAAALKACGVLASDKGSEKQVWLRKGIAIHKQLRKRRLDSYTLVERSLLNMYSKCGSMHHAKEVFDGMVSRDAASWSTLILGYVNIGESSIALDLFSHMDCEESASTYFAALKACSGLATENQSQKKSSLEKGMAIHKQLKERGFESNVVVVITLLEMYSKCGSMEHAREIFDRVNCKDVAMWNALMLGYVENGDSTQTLDLFATMDCEPSSAIYVSALKACTGLTSKQSDESCLERGSRIHEQIKEAGFESDIFVGTALIDMYSKCGRMQLAKEVFDWMVSKDVVTWTSLILGYVENGESLAAIDLFTGMDCKPDSLTYAAALKACSVLASETESEKAVCLEKGISIHKQVEDRGLKPDTVLGSALVDMYCKCGSMQQAREVFDGMIVKNVVIWTTLILGYLENAESLVAMDLFSSMDCDPNPFTYTVALKACRMLATDEKSDKRMSLEKGMSIHREVSKRGLDSDIVVATSLVDMYSKCGSLQRAKEVFDKMVPKDVVAWTSLIIANVENGNSSAALELFVNMDCEPNSVTFTAALKSCANLGALAAGEQIHARICRLALEQDRILVTSLMDLYCNCGIITRAEELFNNVQCPDTVHWNALIAGYGFSGDSSQVFRLSTNMQKSGVKLDGNTFTCILTACSHGGMIEEAKSYFELLLGYGIAVTVRHYTCMVDMLGRANKLEEALALLKSMPVEANAVTWGTLLASCRKWNNLEIGKVAFDALVTSGTMEAGVYMLMSDIYRSLSIGEWEQIDNEKKKAMQAKTLGRTWCCDSEGRTFEFVIGDKMQEEAAQKLQEVLAGY